jgi:hypothetical protein
MSLINDALKKAQRQRAAEDADAATVATSGAGRRSQPRSSQSIALMAGGALVLVIGSVVLTIFLLNRSSDSAPPTVAVATPAAVPATIPVATTPVPAPVTPASATPAPTIAEKKAVAPEPAKTAAPAPTTTAPRETLTRSATPEPSAAGRTALPANATPKASPPPVNPTPVATTPLPAPTTTASSETLARSATAEPSSAARPSASEAPPTPAPAAAGADARIHTYLDGLRINGVNVFGGRALMNDKVHRINEIVDRTLQLRLVKIEANSLTFTDASGFTYVRFF